MGIQGFNLKYSCNNQTLIIIYYVQEKCFIQWNVWMDGEKIRFWNGGLESQDKGDNAFYVLLELISELRWKECIMSPKQSGGLFGKRVI